jgi:hypothetical protein
LVYRVRSEEVTNTSALAALRRTREGCTLAALATLATLAWSVYATLRPQLRYVTCAT